MIAVYLRTESGDEYLFLEKGDEHQVLVSIISKMGEELEYVNTVNTKDENNHNVDYIEHFIKQESRFFHL
jgi:hypothetical protein